MPRRQYVALLRGINVGGKKPVAMATLCTTLEEAGYGRVRTYLQSGNVLLETDSPAKELEPHMEAVLERRFEVPIMVVVRSEQQMRNVVSKAPEGFGSDPDTHHSDVVFLKAPLTSSQAMQVVQLRDGVDAAWPGTGVIYFQRLSSMRTKSRMNKLIGTPQYQQMTIRSWSTARKLVGLLDQHA